MEMGAEGGTTRSRAVGAFAQLFLGLSNAHEWPSFFPTLPEVLGFTATFVEVEPGVRLHVVDRPGSNSKLAPAIFLHGWPDSWRSFQRVFPLLGAERRLIALDQRGFGLSTKALLGSQGFRTFSEDLKIVLDALIVKEIGCLVGHSMGSFVAWHFAGYWPERVNRLVLIGTGTGFDGRYPTKMIMELAPEVAKLKEISYSWVRAFQYSTFANVSTAGTWYLETVVHESLLAPLAVWKETLHALMSVTHAEAERLVPRISAPTVLLHGTKDALFSTANQKDMLELLPQARLEEVPGAGHSVQWEEAGAIVVSTLLREIFSCTGAEASMAVAPGPRSLWAGTSWAFLVPSLLLLFITAGALLWAKRAMFPRPTPQVLSAARGLLSDTPPLVG